MKPSAEAGAQGEGGRRPLLPDAREARESSTVAVLRMTGSSGVARVLDAGVEAGARA